MRNLLFALILAGAVLLFSACAAPAETVELDLTAFADGLLESGLFAEALQPVDDGVAQRIYSIDSAVSASLYVGSGAVADELALFAFESEEAAEEAVGLAEDRVAGQRESFASYIPGEAFKCDSAVIKTVGRYLIVCISEGEEAEELIEGMLEAGG